MYAMKTKKRCNDAELFLEKLRENSSFRKSVCDLSSHTGLQGTLDSAGYDFDEYELVVAVAELPERESDESEYQNYSTFDSCLLDLL